MEHYSAIRLRNEFIHPLTELIVQLTDDARKLEDAAENGVLKHEYLPLNVQMARRSVAQLQRFCRQEIHEKLQAALEGSLKYRAAELASMRQKYHESKADEK